MSQVDPLERTRPAAGAMPSDAAPGADATDAADAALAAAMLALYDDYYRSSDYRRRYPQPNRATLRLLFDCGAAEAGAILDFGCGNGRYTLPLLQHTRADLSCCDISREAIAELRTRLAATPWTARATLRCGGVAQLDRAADFDLVLLLFGVLSHVGGRAERVALLRQLRARLRPGGRLVLTVPSILRRRPLDLLRSALQRATGHPDRLLTEPGNIVFERRIADADRRVFYHLYSARGIRAELREAGFAVRRMEPESLLPEWAVTQSEWLGRIDAAVLRWLPAPLGYGLAVVAEPA
jgi:SAM-dependent methyltransferase